MTKRSDLDQIDGLHGIQLFDWEFDHQPLEDEDEISKCEECGKFVAETETVTVKKYDGSKSFEISFCSEVCANQNYLDRLRSVDGQ